MDWHIKEQTGEKSDLQKDLDLVKKIFQKKIDLFLKDLDSQIDGVNLSYLNTDGMTAVRIYGLSLDISNLEDRRIRIKEYIRENTLHGISGMDENGGYDRISK